MSTFVWVRDDFGQRYAINVDSISWICVDTHDICMSGTDYQGNGIIRICPEDFHRILEMTEFDND